MSWFTPLEIGLNTGLVFAWAVLGLALAFRLLRFPDLTVEGSVPLGAAVYAKCVSSGVSEGVAIVLACVTGALAGALTAIIHIRFKVNKFLAGILVVAIAYSVTLRIMGRSNIGLLGHIGFLQSFGWLDGAGSASLHLGPLVLQVLILLAGLFGLGAVLRARQGVKYRAVGSNPDFAASLGVQPGRYLVTGLAFTNALAAFSGVLLAANQGFADISLGQGVLVLALASLTIGERILSQRWLLFDRFVLVAAVLGSVVYQCLVAFAVRAGLAPTDLKLATAALVLVVVALRVSHGEDSLLGDRS